MRFWYLLVTGTAIGANNKALAGSGPLSLSTDANTALVASFPEGATVFKRNATGTWSQQGKLFGTGAAGDAVQGSALALSGDGNTALVGGLGDNNSVGAVWVFGRDASGNWHQQGNKLVGSGGVSPYGIFQGSSVALSADGSTAVVGGPGDDAGALPECSKL